MPPPPELASHLHGLTHACALNYQVVKSPIPCQLCNLLQQVLTEGAADAAVLHLHQLLFNLHLIHPKP